MTYLKILIAVTSIVFFSLAQLVSAADKSLTVDRVRWKQSTFVWKDHPDYPEWKNQGIWTEYRKNTYISRYWKPSASQVKTMILVLPGQQGFSGASGCSNCVTGQDDAWDNNWGKGDISKTAYIKSHSLVSQLIDSGQFNASNTFLGIVFNPNFNWENTASAKTKAENAFTDWFLKHGYSNRVERIILLGSSRGGALAVRMAHNLLKRSGWSGVPVYVGLIDAVPNTLQNEINSGSGSTCQNPLNSGYYSTYADLNGYFTGLNKPHIRHVITGAPVILSTAVHSFCASPTNWYQQSWANLEHTEIGRCNSTEGDPYNVNFMDAGINKLYDWVMSTL